MAELRICLFGSPCILQDGVPIQIGRRKGIALLAYLAVAPGGQSRETLTSLLWPEAGEATAQAALRQILWGLRKTALADFLEISRNAVALREQEGLSVDVREFRHLSRPFLRARQEDEPLPPDGVESLSRAAQLYVGEFLSGFGVDGSASFEDWQGFESQSLGQELALVLERLIGAHSARGDLVPAMVFAQQWLRVDPASEPAYRHLIALHARAGDRSAALRQYETCVAALDRLLAVPPSDETTGLAEQVRRGEVEELRESARPAARVSRLPAPATPLVGRQEELREIGRLLAEGVARLVTVTGIGGSGKTRLAIEAARRATSQFRDGAVFIPLDAVSDPDLLPALLLDALGGRVAQGSPAGSSAPPTLDRAVERALADYLEDREMLIVLDNAEHLLEGVGFLSGLLEAAPGLRLLVTSRERLSLRGEAIAEVEGLSCPAEGETDVARYPAVQLFVQRAHLTYPRFAPTSADLVSIGRIARLIGGIPLGLELAASWVTSLSPEAIAREIERSLDFLSVPLRDLPPRHRSLRAVFESSMATLSPATRDVFRRLAVFRGGCSLEAATAVAGGSPGDLASLVGKSLLRRLPAGRYQMHETLRQFAGEELGRTKEESTNVRDRYSAYFLRWLAESEQRLRGKDIKEALLEAEDEQGNVVEAWRLAVESRQVVSLRAAAMGLFLSYDIRNAYEEGSALFGMAAERLGEAAEEEGVLLLGTSLVFEAWCLRFLDGARARARFARGLELLSALPPSGELAYALVLAAYFPFSGDLLGDDPIAALRHSLELFEERNHLWGMGTALDALGYLLAEKSLASSAVGTGGAKDERVSAEQRQAEALRFAERSLALRRETGDLWGESLSLQTLGLLHEARGDLARSEVCYQSSLQLREELGFDRLGVAASLLGLLRIALARGEDEKADQRVRAVRPLARKLGSRYLQAVALYYRGVLDRLSGHLDTADAALLEAAQLATSISEDHVSATIAACAAAVALDRGDGPEGARLIERSLTLEPENPDALVQAARRAASEGDPGSAASFLERWQRAASLVSWGPSIGDPLVALAARLASTDQAVASAELLGAFGALPTSSLWAREEAGRVRVRLERQLPQEEVEKAIARGRSHDLDATIRRLREVSLSYRGDYPPEACVT